MDFSNSFKSTTRAFKGKKGKAEAAKADLNKDLEDENMIKPDDLSAVQEIPRNLTIT